MIQATDSFKMLIHSLTHESNLNSFIQNQRIFQEQIDSTVTLLEIILNVGAIEDTKM